MFTTIIIILLLVFTIFVYLIIVGGSLNESRYDKDLEDNEQIKYIRNYKKKKKKKALKRKLFYKRIKNKIKSIFHT